jgi:hypothetical protein
MKINEIITEGIVSGLVGGVKGLAKGVTDLPGKAVAGYKAGAETSVTPPEGWKPGAIQAKTGGGDLAAAIRAGAAGDVGFRQATDAATQDAPEGTAIGQWKKTRTGWINTTNNTNANPAQAKTLDKEWTNFSQKGAKQSGLERQQKLQQQPTGQSAGQQQPAQPAQPAALKILQTVVTPMGQTVFKKSDNKWYRENNNLVVKADDIKQLNQMVINAKELAKAKGTKVPKIIQAQSAQPAQPTKTQTGGRQKGGLSQTPNAIRKRAARAEMPAVFKSNRR